MDAADLGVVSKTRLLSGLPPETVGELLRGAHVKEYPKGYLLFQQGDEAEAFYVVLSGWVKVFRESINGDEAVFGTFTKGETFAEAAMFLGHSYPACAEVVEDARLVRVSDNPFRGRLLAQPEICLSMLASMSMHLHRVVSEVEQLQTRSSAQRLASFVLNLAPVRQGSAVVSLPYDKALVAARLGMKPESLSRGLMRLRSLGVQTEGNRLSIADAAILADFCENRPMRASAQNSCGDD